MTFHLTATFNIVESVERQLFTVFTLRSWRAALSFCTSSSVRASNLFFPNRGSRWLRKCDSLLSTPDGFCRLAFA